jgi:DNA mismatch endonuclease (patch repair protein)
VTDIVDKQTRSRMMSGIRGKDTRPEMLLRRALHAAGFRFRLHSANLPGRPDIVLPRYRAAIFVHGCFWHRHVVCRYASTPATRPEFWAEKFEKNVARDRKNRVTLAKDDWRVGIVWECQLRRRDPLDIVTEMEAWLKGNQKYLEI